VGTRADTSAGRLRVANLEEAASTNRRQGLILIPYGIVMGPTVTAIGALVTQRLTGIARVTSWISVTAVLAIGAIFAAEPALVLLDKYLWAHRER
jgi:hypothetical protein